MRAPDRAKLVEPDGDSERVKIYKGSKGERDEMQSVGGKSD